MKIVGATALVLWALEQAWQIFFWINYRYWRHQYISVKIFYLA